MMPDKTSHHIADAYLKTLLPALKKDGGIWPKAVIFDLDGTLADTVGDIAVALNAALGEIDLAPFQVDDIRLMVGGGLAKLLERALAAHKAELDPELQARTLDRLFEHYAMRPAVDSRLYAGAEEVLRELSALGIACGICTNKPQTITDLVIDGLGMAAAFAFVQGGDSGFPNKPDPAPLEHVMKRLRAAPGDTVMVGDSLADVNAARAAGLAAVILVSYGYTRLPASELGGDVVIDDLRQLPQSLAVLAGRG